MSTSVVMFVEFGFMFVAWSFNVSLGITTSNVPSPVIPVIVSVHVTSELPLLVISKSSMFSYGTAVPFTATCISLSGSLSSPKSNVDVTLCPFASVPLNTITTVLSAFA